MIFMSVNILKLPGAAQPEQKASTNEQSATWRILCFLYKQQTKTHGNKSDAMIHDVQLFVYITSNIKSFSQYSAAIAFPFQLVRKQRHLAGFIMLKQFWSTTFDLHQLLPFSALNL